MKQAILYIALVLTVVGLYGFAFSMNAGGEGKKLFEDKKCGVCHSVNNAGISSKSKTAVDLSSAGVKNNAQFIVKYLNKQEKINGKEHKVAFKGTEQEAKELASFLAAQKKK
ncbi:MAG: c-type cytochrome [Bacteroidota bacterium]|nr:c-type cytochrome [Bacteroidota bacterium]